MKSSFLRQKRSVANRVYPEDVCSLSIKKLYIEKICKEGKRTTAWNIITK